MATDPLHLLLEAPQALEASAYASYLITEHLKQCALVIPGPLVAQRGALESAEECYTPEVYTLLTAHHCACACGEHRDFTAVRPFSDALELLEALEVPQA